MNKLILPIIVLPILCYGATSISESKEDETSQTSTPLIRYKKVKFPTILASESVVKEVRPDIYWTLKIIREYINYFEEIVTTQNQSFPIINGNFKDCTSPDGKETFYRVFSLSKNNIKFNYFNRHLIKHTGLNIEKYLDITKRKKQMFSRLSIEEIDESYKEMILIHSDKSSFEHIESIKTEIDNLFYYATISSKPAINHRKIVHTVESFMYCQILFINFIYNSIYYAFTSAWKSQKGPGLLLHLNDLINKFLEFRKNP